MPPIPAPELIYTTANERSYDAHNRLSAVLERWRDQLGKSNLVAAGVPVATARPFELKDTDVAEDTAYHKAALWSKILPVMLLLWAMTGAFYPAVDLLRGEKERGTLETLLSSPAERSEIVLGKLLTVMLFSMATAVLNMVSMGVAGWLILGTSPEFGPPPPLAPLWLALALVPIAALYSALCLALAAFARSTREGQYYLVPLLLVTMPLAVLPMTPGVELTLGNALIPVTGLVLLLREHDRGIVLAGLAVSAGGAGSDLDRLRPGGPLGGGPVQLRVGPLPRGRAAGRGAVAAAPAARPAADARRGGGRLLRRPHSDDPFLHGGGCRRAQQLCRLRPPNARIAIGGDRHARPADGGHVDQQPAADLAVAASPLVSDPGGGGSGRGPVPGGGCPAGGRDAALPLGARGRRSPEKNRAAHGRRALVASPAPAHPGAGSL